MVWERVGAEHSSVCVWPSENGSTDTCTSVKLAEGECRCSVLNRVTGTVSALNLLTGAPVPLGWLAGKVQSADVSCCCWWRWRCLCLCCCCLNRRLPLDLEGVEVVLRLMGPVKAERRDATWNLPPLMPTEATQHTFTITPTG
jgi:hypothetical protein